MHANTPTTSSHFAAKAQSITVAFKCPCATAASLQARSIVIVHSGKRLQLLRNQGCLQSVGIMTHFTAV
jgi:hypothetical protein